MSVMDLYRDYRLPWMQSGKESDIVISSRVRLARNFSRLPFPNRADFTQLAAVQEMAASIFSDLESACNEEFDAIGMDALTPLERSVLVEKQLISRNLIKKPQYRSVYVSHDRRCSVMVNEEDHLRIQCMAAGLDLTAPFALASRMDDAVEAKLDIAFDEKMGYLTSCPTNLGTGLRASVLLHLPGLVFTRNMNNIINISQQLGLSVRGMYGEGTETVGNVFQVSNQLTLGFTEQGILDNLTSAVKEIIENERRARKALMLYNKDRMDDVVWRAFGTLKYARFIGETEVLQLLSKVRLGIDLGLINEAMPEQYPELILASRPSYLQNLMNNENMSKNEIDRKRAEMVRRILAGESAGQE